MGKLRTTDSFGEISVLGNEPITCSIVTAKPVELGIIYPESLHGRIIAIILQTYIVFLLCMTPSQLTSLDCVYINPYSAGSLFGQYKMMQVNLKMTEMMAHGYSSEST